MISNQRIRFSQQNEQGLLARAAQVLKDRRIIDVRYTTPEEAEELGWKHRALVLELDSGQLVWPSCDDEGNDAGALFTTLEAAPVLPRI